MIDSNATYSGDTPGELNPSLWTFWTFLTVESMVIIAGNLLLFLLFASHKKLRTQQNYFVLSLTISDLLVGLAAIPCEYCAYVQSSSCASTCGTIMSFNMFASVVNLTLIASDRYLYVLKPFAYQKTLSKNRAIVLILVGWLLTLLVSLVPFVWMADTSLTVEKRMKINVVFTLTMFSIVIVLGMFIFFVYLKIVLLIRNKLKDQHAKCLNTTGIKVCIMLAVCYFVCWIPTCVVETMLQYDAHVPKHVPLVTYFILLLNPCLDPILYAYYRKNVRRALTRSTRRIYKRICCKQNGFQQNKYSTRKRKHSEFSVTLISS